MKTKRVHPNDQGEDSSKERLQAIMSAAVYTSNKLQHPSTHQDIKYEERRVCCSVLPGVLVKSVTLLSGDCQLNASAFVSVLGSFVNITTKHTHKCLFKGTVRGFKG